MTRKRKRVRLDTVPAKAINAISLVDLPAIEEDFRLFAIEQLYTLSRADADKQVVTGPAMIPDKLIPRVDPNSNEVYEVYFDAATVEETMTEFMRAGAGSVNINHDQAVEDVTVIESWIVTDPANDKAKALGYDVPQGTWMISMKVDNPTMWQLAKTGVVRGFSIEGYFLAAAEELMSKIIIDRMKENFKAIVLADGTSLYTAGDLVQGAEVYADEAMTAPAADGSYELPDGQIAIVAGGKIVETAAEITKEPQAATGPDIDQIMAMVSDLTSRVMALEDQLSKSAEARGESEAKLAVAMSKIAELEKQPAGRSVTAISERPEGANENPFMRIARAAASQTIK